MTISNFEEANLNKSWKAKLQLKFVEENNKTILSHRSHQGPLQIQKLFYPESNGACHVYILHPPGGVVGGDRSHGRRYCRSWLSPLAVAAATQQHKH